VAVPEPRRGEGYVQVPLVWVGTEELPIHFVNQFAGVIGPGEIFLYLGSVMPPPILGDTEEERTAQAESIRFVQVKPVARMALTPERLREFIAVLKQTLTNYESQQRTLNQ
jgi:hypothetical protein